MNDATPAWGDDRGVPLAAGRLGITEFELFCAAYESWFAHAASQHRIEKYFVQYLFYGDVPYWVRHFTRSTVGAVRAQPVRHRGQASGVRWCFVLFLDFVPGLLARMRPRRDVAGASLEA